MSNYATVEEAITWVAEDSGKHPVRDRAHILGLMNDARRLFYTVYQRVRLDFYIEGCVQVQDFCQPCLDCPGNQETYSGICLPPEIEQVEALWSGCAPIPLYDRWVEYRTFIRSSNSASLKAIDVGGDHPLQADIPCGKCALLKFTATDLEDCGKVITVRYRDSGNQDRLDHIPLSLEGSCIETPAYSIARPGGVVLPVGLKGGIIVQNATDGLALGRLAPRTTVPSFRRLKLTGICAGTHVAFRGTRKFTEVFWDWEVIEVGGEQKLALIEAVRYQRLNGVNSADPAWMGKAKTHLENVTQYLAGSNMRSDGATTIRRIELFKTAGTHRSRLNAGRR